MKASRVIPILAFTCLMAIFSTAVHAEGPTVPKPVFTGYDEKADGRVLVTDALAEARASKRRVLLIFGANWCGPCRKLHGLLHDNKTLRQLVESQFVVVNLDVSGSHNSDVDNMYGNPTKLGLPSLVVLGSDGRLLKVQGTKEFAEGNHQNGAKVLKFLRTWAAVSS